MLIDTHCHLTKQFLDDPTETVHGAKEGGVTKMICVGTSLEDSKEAIEIAQKFDGVFASVGIHPEENYPDWHDFEKLLSQPKVVAIGECGLDWSKLPQENKPKGREIKKQNEIFLKQIELSVKYDLPLIIHVRDAQKNIIEMFSHFEKPGLKGVFHCFSGEANYLGFILRQLPDFYVSFAGNVTFKNAKELQELASLTPLNRLLVETDSPFLAPVPLRGSQNKPENVKIIASYLANLKGVGFEELAKKTSANASFLFKI